MSIEHISLLRSSLEKRKWVIREELPGDDIKVSAVWRISRPNEESEFNLVFEGLDDLEILPIEKAYACHVEHDENLALYFGKVGKSFPNDLSDFVEKL